MADVERPGGICRDKLDLNGFLFLSFDAPVVLAVLQHLPYHLQLGLGLDPDIEKAGARHGERLEQAGCRQRGRAGPGDLLGDLPRVAPQALGELERDVARVIAVLSIDSGRSSAEKRSAPSRRISRNFSLGSMGKGRRF